MYVGGYRAVRQRNLKLQTDRWLFVSNGLVPGEKLIERREGLLGRTIKRLRAGFDVATGARPMPGVGFGAAAGGHLQFPLTWVTTRRGRACKEWRFAHACFHATTAPRQINSTGSTRPRLCENSSALAAHVGHSSIWSICEKNFASDRTLAVVVRRSFPPRWSFHSAWTQCQNWPAAMERPLSGRRARSF